MRIYPSVDRRLIEAEILEYFDACIDSDAFTEIVKRHDISEEEVAR